jgi:hypothetical protein
MAPIRSLLLYTLACTALYAADQRDALKQDQQADLPPPLSLAIKRLANPAEIDKMNPNPFLEQGDKPLVLVAPEVGTRFGAGQCSIPLAEPKLSDKPKFLIQREPGKNKDGMPVLRARVCNIVEAK